MQGDLHRNVQNSIIFNGKKMEKHEGSSLGEQINKPWHIHTMKNNMTVKINDLKKYLHWQSQKKVELKKQSCRKILIIW